MFSYLTFAYLENDYKKGKTYFIWTTELIKKMNDWNLQTYGIVYFQQISNYWIFIN